MYTLRRDGTFHGTPLGCCHCGPDNLPREYQYRYSITVYNCSLDSMGFVLDNQIPQQWFDSMGKGFTDSCELLAQRAAFTFARLCKKPYQVSVCIVGFETAAAEFSYYPQILPLRIFWMVYDCFYSLLTTRHYKVS